MSVTSLPVLDWRSHHDPRSLDYPIRALLPTSVERKFTLYDVGPILDQGKEGACVGHGWTDEATAAPVKIDFAAENLGNDDQGKPWPTDAQAFAFALYHYAQRHDSQPGEDYSGTSVLAGAKAMKALGFLAEYRWATSLDDVIDAICAHGPVVFGMDWYSGMYQAPNGELRLSGSVVGGHCILGIGFDPEHEFSNGEVAPAIALQNSWGPSWGVNGVAWIRVSDLARVLAKTGEACVPVKRLDPGHPTPAPVPTPTPAPEPKPEPKPVHEDSELVRLIKALIATLTKLLERL